MMEILVTDNLLVYFGLKTIIRRPDLALCTPDKFEEGKNELSVVDREPSIVILDESMGSVRCARLSIRENDMGHSVVLMGRKAGSSTLQSIVRGRFSGRFFQEDSSSDILRCLNVVRRGGCSINGVESNLSRTEAKKKMRRLSPRENQIVGLVSEGRKNREIAEELGIAQGTVKIHLLHVFDKMGISSRNELIERSLSSGRRKRSDGSV